MLINERLQKTLEHMESRYLEISKSLESELLANTIIKLNKEKSQIEKIVQKFQKIKQKTLLWEECKQIISEKDNEYFEVAKEEVEIYEQEINELEKQIQQLLLPQDPNDSKNVIVEMRAAAGGDESSIFVGNLFDTYKRYADNNQWNLKIMEIKENDSGIHYLSFSIAGKSVYSKMKFESGVHRVQRVPKTESKGRVHTSTITVSVLPEQDEVEITINPTDLRIDVYRASGAGGQHVNKTESAVRICHGPSGIVVECQQERSQIANRDHAMKMLRSKLWQAEKEAQEQKISQSVRENIGGGGRAEKIRTYNYPQNRVTDHRISLTVKKLDEIMLGDLKEIHEHLNNNKKMEELKNIV